MHESSHAMGESASAKTTEKGAANPSVTSVSTSASTAAERGLEERVHPRRLGHEPAADWKGREEADAEQKHRGRGSRVVLVDLGQVDVEHVRREDSGRDSDDHCAESRQGSE